MSRATCPWPCQTCFTNMVVQQSMYVNYFFVPLFFLLPVAALPVKRLILYGCLVLSSSQCVTAVYKGNWRPCQGSNWLFSFEELIKIQAGFGKIVGWRGKPLELISFEKQISESGTRYDRNETSQEPRQDKTLKLWACKDKPADTCKQYFSSNSRKSIYDFWDQTEHQGVCSD